MFGNNGRKESRVALKIGSRRVRVNSRAAVACAVVGVSLLAASGAQAQQACSNAFFSGRAAGGLAASPAALSAVVGSTITTASTAFLLQSTAFIGSPGNPSPYQQGGGVWARGVGGEIDVKSTSNAIGGTPPPVTNTVALSCLQKIHQDFGGVQVGTDISRLNINGWNVHLGTTAGYLETRGRLVGGAATVQDLPNGFPATVGGGEFNSTTKIPFAGTYAAATKDGFFIDGLLRFEYYQNTLDAPGLNLFAQNIDAHGVSFSSSVGYQWQVPNSRWFVEPSAGVIISRVKVDSFNFATAGVPGITDFIGTLQFDQIKSNVGRFGVRVGTTIESGKLILQPFAAVSFWHEFGPEVSSVYQTCSARTGGGGCLFFNNGTVPSVFSSSNTTTTIGTFGQYSLGFSAAVANTGWLAFARVDYRNGSNLESLSGTGGIRYQFTPDKSRRVTKDGIAGAEFVNWTGLYVGGFGSALLGFADWNYVGGGVSPRVGGYLFGGNVGYNYQTGAWVLGIEAELGKTNLIGSTACGPLLADVTGTANAAPGFMMTCNAWANWIGTATARVGYAWERVLLYAKAGGAWTREYVSATCNYGPNHPVEVAILGGIQACTNPAEAISNGFAASGNTRTGWIVGYGTEFALTRNWSARAEYNYIKFGDRNVIASDGSVLNIGMHVSEAKVGLNYRFDNGVVYK
jgi:opacity protein-like surface antigen